MTTLPKIGPDLGYPVLKYRFKVQVNTAGVPNPVDMEFQQVSGLVMQREIERNGTMMSLKYTGKSMPIRTLTLKRGVFTATSVLTTKNLVETAGDKWNTRLLRKDLIIECINAKNTPLVMWIVENAYLQKWTWDDLNATSNEVLIESLEFAYTNLKFVPEMTSAQKP